MAGREQGGRPRDVLHEASLLVRDRFRLRAGVTRVGFYFGASASAVWRMAEMGIFLQLSPSVGTPRKSFPLLTAMLGRALRKDFKFTSSASMPSHVFIR